MVALLDSTLVAGLFAAVVTSAGALLLVVAERFVEVLGVAGYFEALLPAEALHFAAH